jgi:cold-inducible RNA-binding protein
VLRIFVSNINYAVTELELRTLFVDAGYDVERLRICTDRDTGQPRGFAFVEMEDEDAARFAIRDLQGTELKGRRLNVQEAHEQGERPGVRAHAMSRR